MARLPDLIGTIPPFFSPYRGTLEEPELLQKGDGHVEVALVFVDVLQGFETFVHRTEILQISDRGQSFNTQASFQKSEAVVGIT